jgi:hypothetical protein
LNRSSATFFGFFAYFFTQALEFLLKLSNLSLPDARFFGGLQPGSEILDDGLEDGFGVASGSAEAIRRSHPRAASLKSSSKGLASVSMTRCSYPLLCI